MLGQLDDTLPLCLNPATSLLSGATSVSVQILNTAIAEAMVVSVKAVETYVTRIFNKLGTECELASRGSA